MRTKLIFIPALLILNFASAKSIRTICGDIDTRVRSYDPAIARLRTSLEDLDSSCTATLIGNNCMITAGHCYSLIHFIEFNTKLSRPSRELVRSSWKDIYLADRSSIKHGRNYYPGFDWAIFRVFPNRGENNLEISRGVHPVSFSRPKAGELLSITGYGRDDGEFNRVQQVAIGELTKITGKRVFYQVDTMSGNSGSSVLNNRGEVVGIHTQGGCSESAVSNNNGTLIFENRNLIEAIKNCLEYSKDNKSRN